MNDMNTYTIPEGSRIGHIHLKVSDLERALGFYRDVLGFELTAMYGKDAAFLSAGGYHHHIGLNTWSSKGGMPPPKGSTGLFHTAIVLPERKDLAALVERLHDMNYPISGAADHGVSEAIYLEDPDHNGVELYWDRPKASWPLLEDGSLMMYTRPLDIQDLMKELN